MTIIIIKRDYRYIIHTAGIQILGMIDNDMRMQNITNPLTYSPESTDTFETFVSICSTILSRRRQLTRCSSQEHPTLS